MNKKFLNRKYFHIKIHQNVNFTPRAIIISAPHFFFSFKASPVEFYQYKAKLKIMSAGFALNRRNPTLTVFNYVKPVLSNYAYTGPSFWSLWPTFPLLTPKRSKFYHLCLYLTKNSQILGQNSSFSRHVGVFRKLPIRCARRRGFKNQESRKSV